MKRTYQAMTLRLRKPAARAMARCTSPWQCAGRVAPGAAAPAQDAGKVGVRIALAQAAQRRHLREDLAEARLGAQREPAHGDGGQMRQHGLHLDGGEAALARSTSRERSAGVLGAQQVTEDGVAVRPRRLVPEDVPSAQISDVVAAAQRFDEIGEPAARERVLLQVPGQFRHHRAHYRVGMAGSDGEGGGQLIAQRCGLHLLKRVAHLHGRSAPPLTPIAGPGQGQALFLSPLIKTSATMGTQGKSADCNRVLRPSVDDKKERPPRGACPPLRTDSRSPWA